MMLQRRSSILWSLLLAFLAVSLPVESNAGGGKKGFGKLAKPKVKQAKPKVPSRAQKGPKPARPSNPRAGGNTKGRRGYPGAGQRRGRSDSRRSSKDREKKKKDEKRWYVVQLGRDFQVAEKKQLKSLRKKAATQHEKALSAYEKAKAAAEGRGGDFNGRKPPPTVYKVLTSAGFSSESKAKAYRSRVAKEAQKRLRERGLDRGAKKGGGKKGGGKKKDKPKDKAADKKKDKQKNKADKKERKRLKNRAA